MVKSKAIHSNCKIINKKVVARSFKIMSQYNEKLQETTEANFLQMMVASEDTDELNSVLVYKNNSVKKDIMNLSKEEIDQQLAPAIFQTPFQVDACNVVIDKQLVGSYPDTKLMMKSTNSKLEVVANNVETTIAGSCTKSTPISHYIIW